MCLKQYDKKREKKNKIKIQSNEHESQRKTSGNDSNKKHSTKFLRTKEQNKKRDQFKGKKNSSETIVKAF